MDPDAKTFNMFFEKSDCAISPPVGEVVRPAHVALLDYEIELALVFKRPITGPVTVTPASLPDYVFGLTIANEISARDVQIPQTRFFKGKSYRGFCPIGAYLAVLEPGDFANLDNLTLTLAVNGSVRQQDETRDLVYKPAETITELSQFNDVAFGDVLLTGTPAGCALRVPGPLVRKLMHLLLPEKKFWAAFRLGPGTKPEIPAARRRHDADHRQRRSRHRSRRTAYYRYCGLKRRFARRRKSSRHRPDSASKGKTC